MNEKSLLVMNNLSIKVGTTDLVSRLNFSLKKGKTLGMVGESGSGKSLTGLAIMGLLPPKLAIDGSIWFKKKELVKLGFNEHRLLRGKEMSMIFQEPMTSLNPTMKCGQQVAENLQMHLKMPRKKAYNRVIELFEKVKLFHPKLISKSYPHQISGGQQQRVMIASAIACQPQLLIADEPTTALDGTVQLEILELLNELQKDYGMAMIFVTHDLSVVRYVSDELLIVHRGKLVERGETKDIMTNPKQAYTKGLLACRPTFDTSYHRLPLAKDFTENPLSLLKRENKTDEPQQTRKFSWKLPLLQVKGLNKVYRSTSWLNRSNEVQAVREVAFEIYPGESLGLIGESGSGKSTIGKMLTGLEKASRGSILFEGKDISSLNRGEWRKINRHIQVVFQDPFSSLNPRIKIGEALREVISYHSIHKGNKATREARNILLKTGLTEESYSRYPHEFSGGERQRISIARALALNPKFIICDESVSALDVSVQAQILNLLNDLKEDFCFTYLFISHDLAVVKYFCDRIIVLKDGEIVEVNFSDHLYKYPQNQYTKKLIAAAQL